MPELALSVDIDAPAQAVWDAVVDWDTQGEWMLATTVRGTVHEGRGVGGQLEAFTGVWRIGFLDTMTITTWDPPRRCLVVHTGKVVRGTGAFEVEELGPGRSRFRWSEQVDLPLGLLGRIGWVFTKPLVAAGLRYSLRRLARKLSTARPPQAW